jgi:hypothetical protein
MPYSIVKRGDKYLTINKETGKVKGTHDTRKKAVAQMRLLYKIENQSNPKLKRSKKSKRTKNARK